MGFPTGRPLSTRNRALRLHPSAAIKAECKVYYIKPELFELGKTMEQTPAGNPVLCYDLERTICDVIRSRNKIGTETFLSALKQYAASPKKDLNRLDEYARQMRVSGVLRNIWRYYCEQCHSMTL